MIYTKLASAIYNDIMSGLAGMHLTPKISIEQLEDEIVLLRLALIKAYTIKGILPKKELMVSLNCVPVDCLDIDRCNCPLVMSFCEKEKIAHFEMPQVNFDFDSEAIDYIGSTDRQLPFLIYTNLQLAATNQYRKRGALKPYVYIDYTPNKNNMLDGYIFNAPLLKSISIVFIPKDPRQLENLGCCQLNFGDNLNFIDSEVKDLVTKNKILYYRSLQIPIEPNTLKPV